MHRNASTTIFMIPELAELILLHLGNLDHRTWKQLFIMQRLNTTFRSLISESPALRQTMHLAQPDPRLRATKFPDAIDIYRNFFFALEHIFYPFWSHVRAIADSHTIVLDMNLSMFWSEEVSKVPGTTLDGSNPIEQRETTWRHLLIPHYPEYDVELHCCGYDVMVRFGRNLTLGEVADEAVRAGRAHLGSSCVMDMGGMSGRV